MWSRVHLVRLKVKSSGTGTTAQGHIQLYHGNKEISLFGESLSNPLRAARRLATTFRYCEILGPDDKPQERYQDGILIWTKGRDIKPPRPRPPKLLPPLSSAADNENAHNGAHNG